MGLITWALDQPFGTVVLLNETHNKHYWYGIEFERKRR